MNTYTDTLRAKGLNVIPCKDRSKMPSVPWREYQEKKCFLDIQDNAAVICGKISGNLVVIDVDDPKLVDHLFADFDEILSNTLVVKTGSGGYHIYVRNVGDTVKTKRLDYKEGHFDIQSEGCYVITPGSIHPNGNKYVIISTTQNINTMHVDAFLSRLNQLGIDTHGSGLPDVENIAKGVKIGNRNNSAFKYIAHLLGTLKLDKETAWREIQKWNKDVVKPPLPKLELETVFNSAYQRVGVNKVKAVKAIEEHEEEESKKRKMHDISSKDEGELITFDALVTGTDTHKTVTFTSTVECPKCAGQFECKGTGFDNPQMPICDKCHMRMIEMEKTRKTIDLMVVLLEQLPEEIKDNIPVRFTAKVNGSNLFKLLPNKRYTFTARFTSMTELGNKRLNEITLQIRDLKPLDEPDGVCLNNDEIKRIKESLESKGLEEIYNSIAPELLGISGVKESVLTAMAGSYKRGSIRGDINLMIVGNPSRGKSQILKYISRVAPKSSYVNGKSSTGVGLTSSMVKLPNGTSIQRAGKMVTNSGGSVCIDEGDKMRPGDRGNLLECMEQQTVTLDKSGSPGIPLDAITAVFMACNPKNGVWDEGLGVLGNLNLEIFFLSRFDKIWNLSTISKLEQSKIADHVLNDGQPYAFLNEQTMSHYLNTIRKLRPKLSDEARKMIRAFFLKMCEMIEEGGEKLPMETRQLEGLMRACIARARCYMVEEVTEKMVLEEIALYKKSLISLNLKVTDTSIQKELVSSQVTKDTAVLKSWRAVEDEEGYVDRTAYTDYLLMNFPKYFPDIFAVEKMWKQNEGTRFLLQPNRKYRLSL